MEDKKIKKKTNEKAITLIALIITIIILLILAGITISTLSGPNGILKNTQKAKEETIESTYIEIIETTMQGENISIRAKQKDINEVYKEITSQFEKEDWIHEVQANDIVENNYGIIKITSKDGYIFYITEYIDGTYEIEYGKNPDEIQDAVARIGVIEYPSLQEAIDASKDNEKTMITLLKDTTENININENKDLILKIANYTVEGTAKNYGNIEIRGGTLKSLTSNTVNNYDGAKITINRRNTNIRSTI